MTQEDKDLLLKDLCARLPYGVICHYNCVIPFDGRLLKKANVRDVLKGIIPMFDGHIGFMVGTDKVDALEGDIKPYLRSMSSMTEEECDMVEEILGDKCIFDFMANGDIVLKQGQFSQNKLAKLYDYYNSIHVDYRGLIPIGLAIAVTKENNPYKE